MNVLTLSLSLDWSWAIECIVRLFDKTLALFLSKLTYWQSLTSHCNNIIIGLTPYSFSLAYTCNVVIVSSPIYWHWVDIFVPKIFTQTFHSLSYFDLLLKAHVIPIVATLYSDVAVYYMSLIWHIYCIDNMIHGLNCIHWMLIFLYALLRSDISLFFISHHWLRQ